MFYIPFLLGITTTVIALAFIVFNILKIKKDTIYYNTTKSFRSIKAAFWYRRVFANDRYKCFKMHRTRSLHYVPDYKKAKNEYEILKELERAFNVLTDNSSCTNILFTGTTNLTFIKLMHKKDKKGIITLKERPSFNLVMRFYNFIWLQKFRKYVSPLPKGYHIFWFVINEQQEKNI